MAIKYFFALIVLIQYSIVNGQNGINEQYWTDINTSFFLSKRTNFVSDIGYRHQINEPKWNQFLIRPGVNYTLSTHWFLTGGVGYFYKDSKSTEEEQEVRLYQGLKFTTSFYKRLTFKNYFRVEERFRFLYDEEESTVRIRNQATLLFHLKNTIESRISIPLSIEIFTGFDNVTSKLFSKERGRYFTGIDYSRKDHWRLELLLNIQGSNDSLWDESSPTDLFFRTRFFLYLRKSNFKKEDSL